MVIEYTEQDQLNGLFSNLFSSTNKGEQKKQAESEIQDIRNENGINDLMYMKPEQAAKSVNKALEELAFWEAKKTKEIKGHKSKSSKEAKQLAADLFSDASAQLVSEFRQYGIGMDGEITKIGSNKKTRDNIEFQTPFYKLSLPATKASTAPSNGITKDDLLNLFTPQNQSNTAPQNNNTALYVGIGIGAIALIGGVAYIIKTKK